jgi:Tol biopolymer transport system component
MKKLKISFMVLLCSLLLLGGVAASEIMRYEKDLTRMSTDVAADSSPSWSSDGKKVIYESEGAIIIFDLEKSGSKKSEVGWVYDLANPTKAEATTYLKKPHDTPRMSPDGTKIAFVSNQNGNKDIWVINTDGSGLPKQLTTDPTDDKNPAWSPDGKKIAYDSGQHVYIIDPEGGTPQDLCTTYPKNCREPVFSPDGRKIAFVSNQAGNDDIWVMDVDGKNPKQVTTDPTPEQHPSWSNDGKVAFQAEVHAWIMNEDGSGRTEITSSPDLNYYKQPEISPDGRVIAFVSAYKGNDDIWLMNVSTEEQAPLGTTPTTTAATTAVVTTAATTPAGATPLGTTPTATKPQPAFEIVFAMAGLLAVYLAFRKRR